MMRSFINSNKARYLVSGAWNTLFGYSVMVALYEIFSPSLNIIFIAILANVAAITMAFLTYKCFVFHTKGNWFLEYVKSYLVYGSLTVLNIFLTWLLVEQMGISIWISQGICIPIAVVISYVGHSRFTFKNSA